MAKQLFLAIAAVTLLGGNPAKADTVLLNTITDPFNPNGGLVVGPPPSPGLPSEAHAIQFTITSAETITSIQTYITSVTGPGTVNLGIMASVGGLPSGSFLDSSTASFARGSEAILNGLSWTLGPGTYWLVATSNTFDIWNQGSIAAQYASSLGSSGAGPWALTTAFGGLPEAEIMGVAVTPLPAALPLFAGGLGALGLLGWRKKRRPQLAQAT